MKKLTSFVFVLFACFTLIAETYKITDITRSNDGKGMAKDNNGAFLKMGNFCFKVRG